MAKAVETQFGPSRFDSPRSRLFKLFQTTTATAYYTDFLVLSTRVEGMTDDAILDCFISGLKPTLRRDIRAHEPQTLIRAAELARLFEESGPAECSGPPASSRAWHGSPVALPAPSKFSPGSLRISSPSASVANTGQSSAVSGSGSTSPAHSPPPYKRLSAAELRAKREKGLCYYCDAKYTPQHKCQPSFFLLLGPEEFSEVFYGSEPTITEVDVSEDASPELQLLSPEISLYALEGAFHPRTLRLTGYYKRESLKILVDSGSTLNFIKGNVARRLHLPFTPVAPFNVRTGGGDSLRCIHKCEAVSFSVQGVTLVAHFFVLEISRMDMVLGVQWLAQLGNVVSNYSRLTMSFFHHEQQVTLQGNSKLDVSPLPHKDFLKLLDSDSAMGLFTLQCTDTTSTPDVPPTPTPVSAVVERFSSVFQEQTQLPPRRLIDHRIPLFPDAKPINVRPYRYPHFQKSKMEKLVQEMLTSGVIRDSQSAFSSPVLLVKKKDGSWRFCVDYRALNDVTVKDKFPIPTIDEILDELFGAAYFSKLDLRSGYHQIRMSADDIHKTAFRTHQGHYEFVVMPFGLTNAPSTFQAAMNKLFQAQLRKFVAVFFDDILVYSTTLEDHCAHLTIVLQLLHDNSFFVKLSKCSFGQPSIDYLGHIVSKEGVSVDPQKVAAMLDWPPPTTLKQLRGFLGLTGYYRRFVRGYAHLAFPLTELLKKHQFKWSSDAQVAFDELKQRMVRTPVLALPDFSKLFYVETDASGYGIGAVLSQENHPLAFFSKKLSQRLMLSSAYVRELYAVTQAVMKWRHYLLGRKFIIQTDHRSLRELVRQVVQTPEQQFYLAKLMGFNYEIVYRAGSSNHVADALSRQDDPSDIPETECHFFAITTAQSTVMDNLKLANESHPQCLHLHDQFRRGSLSGEYSVREGYLFYGDKYFVPDDNDLQTEILEYFHSSPVGGHGGVLKTLTGISEIFYWAGLRHSVQEYVKSCLLCQQTKYSTSKPLGLLQPLPIPTRPWEELSMDFVVGLPPSHGYTAIFVIVDRLTKGAHFAPLKPKFTARIVAELFVSTVVKLHGFPTHIVSDRDPIFFSSFWRGIMKNSGTQLHYSSAYHPQTDGQTEVVNRCLEQYLRVFTVDQPSAWSEFLPMAEFWYNTSFHSASSMTPYQALYGFNPTTFPTYKSGTSSVDSVEALLLRREDLRSQLRVNLERAQTRMKKFVDSKRRDKHFAVGDLVLVKLHHYRQSSVARRLNFKLSRRYYGPFPVEARVGSVAYKLTLPDGSRIHPVFHVSLLKTFHGVPSSAIADTPDDVALSDPVPVAIVDRRQGAPPDDPQVLVEWQGKDRDEATWVSWQVLRELFPDLALEDKVLFDGEANDTSSKAGGRSNVHVAQVDQLQDGSMNEDAENQRPKRTTHAPVWTADYCMKK